jgi:hypothetical protein
VRFRRDVEVQPNALVERVGVGRVCLFEDEEANRPRHKSQICCRGRHRLPAFASVCFSKITEKRHSPDRQNDVQCLFQPSAEEHQGHANLSKSVQGRAQKSPGIEFVYPPRK